jgi:hypothetical protein
MFRFLPLFWDFFGLKARGAGGCLWYLTLVVV